MSRRFLFCYVFGLSLRVNRPYNDDIFLDKKYDRDAVKWVRMISSNSRQTWENFRQEHGS